MPRDKDAIWKQVLVDDEDKSKCSCNHCNKEIGASVRTIRSHMLSCPRISQINRISAERSIKTAKQKSKSIHVKRLDYHFSSFYSNNNNFNSNSNSNSNDDIELPSSSNNKDKKSKQSQSTLVCGDNYYFRMSASHQARADELLCYFIAKEAEALSIVDKDSFRKFIEYLNPTYVMPKRGSLTQTHLPRLHTRVEKEVKKCLTEMGSCTIGLDGSSDGNKNPIEHILATKG